MADIRSEDRGYHTRVFSITSKTIGKRQICIGRRYDENGRDRYNVYPVENGAVGGKVGYYELESGTKVEDDAGDFDVARFNEPTWTIGKPKQPETEPEVALETPPRTNFEIVDTVTDGNCFYDTVTRALAGKPYKKDEKAIMALRKRLGDFITNDQNLPDLVDHYKTISSPEQILMKDDAYYGKYYEYLEEESMNMEEIEEDMEKERKNHKIPLTKLNIDDFKKMKPDDESPNQSDSENALATEIKDYFDGDKNLKTSEDIKTTFLKKMNTSGIWASEYVIAKFQVMENIMMIFLDHDSTSEIENLNVHLWSLYMFDPNANTRYILSDYESMRHFKLIAQNNPELSVFTKETLPESINKKLVKPTVQKKKSARKPKVDVPEPESPGTAREESPKSDTAREESPPARSPSPVRAPSPARETKSDTARDETPPKSDTKEGPSGFNPPYTDADVDRLTKLKVPELKELLNHEHFKDVLKSNLNKNSIIDCLLGRESCKTKKKKKGGERFTRRK